MAFALEVKGWVDFEVEKIFDSQTAAQLFGAEQYPQNDWRIRHIERNVVVHEHNSFQLIEKTVQLEIGRFQRSEDWVRQRSERMEQAARLRTRLSNVATRQRRDQRDKKNKQQILERVNWMVEGF